MATHPLAVGVVVVNWNGCRDTLACLESLARTAPAPRSVVVVDNGSTDGSVETITGWAATRSGLRVVVLAAGANRGFSAGNNLGLAHLARDSG
ncbi:MAG: glycosyltransferase family 2 protein, partial [Gemmatimonadetes bacterium]